MVTKPARSQDDTRDDNNDDDDDTDSDDYKDKTFAPLSLVY